MSIRFWVPGKPVGYSRDAVAYRSTPDEIDQWRRDVQICYRAAAPFDMPRDGEYTGEVTLLVRTTGAQADVDNIGKEIMDALKAVAFRDDAQVIDLHVTAHDRRLTSAGRPKKPTGEQGVWVEVGFPGLDVADGLTDVERRVLGRQERPQ